MIKACTDTNMFAIIVHFYIGFVLLYSLFPPLACPGGSYGPDCFYNCTCENNSTCDAKSGTCNCTTPGFTGLSCEMGKVYKKIFIFGVLV